MLSDNGDGRLDGIAHVTGLGSGAIDLFKVAYGYDAVGNRTFTRHVESPTLPDDTANPYYQPSRSERYGYDP